MHNVKYIGRGINIKEIPTSRREVLSVPEAPGTIFFTYHDSYD